MTARWRPYVRDTYEHPTHDCGIDVASVWTAHLPLAHSSALPTALDALTELGHRAGLGLTGEYLHEASYHQWGEPPDPCMDADPDHFAVYFLAPTVTRAVEVAEMLLDALAPAGVLGALAHGRYEVVLTHGDDWEWDHTTATPTPAVMEAPAGVGVEGR